MTDEAAKPKPKLAVVPADALDLSDLWIDSELADGITDEVRHRIPFGKPRDFFRLHPDPTYRRKVEGTSKNCRCRLMPQNCRRMIPLCSRFDLLAFTFLPVSIAVRSIFRGPLEMYRHKTEDAIDEEYFVFAKGMHRSLIEAAPYTLVVCVYRDGTPRIWPLRLPKEGERDNEAWVSAREVAKVSLTKWVKLLWKGRGFLAREARPGYAPDPAWEKLPPFNELLTKAVGEKNIIRDSSHSMYRNLIGDEPMGGIDGGDGG